MFANWCLHCLAPSLFSVVGSRAVFAYCVGAPGVIHGVAVLGFGRGRMPV